MGYMTPASVLAVLAAGRPAFGLIFADASAVEALAARVNELVEASETIMAQADAEKRDLTAEENTQFDNNMAEVDKIRAEIARRERLQNQVSALATPRGRQTEAEPIEGESAEPAVRPAANGRPATPAVVPGRARAGGTFGFRSFGDFSQAVRAAAVGGQTDARLRNAAATTYGNESVGADGGFAVPPDYRSEIMSKVFGEASLIARTDQLQSSSNTIVLPSDMTTPWQTTGGIQAFWEAEAATMTQSKPALESLTFRLHKLTALVPVTEELLEDAPALDAYLRRKAAEKIDFKISNAIVWGTGAGMPLGYMNSPALVTQAAEGGQTADTINATNVAKMYARMPAGSLPTSVWLIHPDAVSQLPLMSIANQPIYLPPGGFSAAPYGTLLGRPVIPHQTAKSIGDLGDIQFVDLAQYLTAVKTGGLRTDVSMHLWFDQDLLAYKFRLRVAGQPWWSQATAALNGSFTMSPFVTLAAR